jgi:electron transport complex protein RnfD
MPRRTNIEMDLLPTKATLETNAPPHWRAALTHVDATWMWIAAAALPAGWAVLTYGTAALSILAVSISVGLLSEFLINAALTRHRIPPRGWESHALLVGLLVALTMPCSATRFPLLGAALASLIAAVIGRMLAGGQGNYLWHPAAVGRVAAPILLGSLFASHVAGAHAPWPSALDGLGVLIHESTRLAEPGHSALTVLLRDHMPPWDVTLFNLPATGTGPPLGSAVIALVPAMLLLIWTGHIRPSGLVLGALGAVVAACILPLRLPSGVDTQTSLVWFPVLIVDNHLPVGLVYVLYQITAGELLLVLLLANDSVASPMTVKGHRWYGAGVGALTIALRLAGLIGTAGFWALLAMNTLVPWIDRCTKRRVYGT